MYNATCRREEASWTQAPAKNCVHNHSLMIEHPQNDDKHWKWLVAGERGPDRMYGPSVFSMIPQAGIAPVTFAAESDDASTARQDGPKSPFDLYVSPLRLFRSYR